MGWRDSDRFYGVILHADIIEQLQQAIATLPPDAQQRRLESKVESAELVLGMVNHKSDMLPSLSNSRIRKLANSPHFKG